MHSDAIWNVKYQDFIMNKVISCGYNDAWFAKNHALAKKNQKLPQPAYKMIKLLYILI